MADFTAKKINNPNQDLNNGKGQYINGVDIPNADDWNSVINSQLWTQKLAENPVDNSEANNVGVAEIVIAYNADGTPYLKAKNLKGGTGATGRGITETSTTYAQSATNTEIPPDNSWAEQIPNVPAGNYLWTRTAFKYSDSTISYSYSFAKQGEKGDKGNTGTSVTIRSKAVEYMVRTSGNTIPPITGWSATVPDVPQGQYLWSRTSVLYSNGESTVTYGVAYQGKDGATPTIDTAMSSTSTNPVQNKVIKAYVDDTVASAITTILNTAV